MNTSPRAGSWSSGISFVSDILAIYNFACGATFKKRRATWVPCPYVSSQLFPTQLLLSTTRCFAICPEMNGSVSFRPESRMATRTALCCHDGRALELFVAKGLIYLLLKRVTILKNSLAKSSVLSFPQSPDRRSQGDHHRPDSPSTRGQHPFVVQYCS